MYIHFRHRIYATDEKCIFLCLSFFLLLFFLFILTAGLLYRNCVKSFYFSFSVAFCTRKSKEKNFWRHSSYERINMFMQEYVYDSILYSFLFSTRLYAFHLNDSTSRKFCAKSDCKKNDLMEPFNGPRCRDV